MNYMYILECADGSFYIGSTKNLEKRLWQHQNGQGANFTKKRLPVKLVYCEPYERIDDAFNREKQVQGWSRRKKQALIERNYENLIEFSKNYTEFGRPAAVSTGTSARLSHPSTFASGAPDGVAPEPVEGRTVAQPAAVSTGTSARLSHPSTSASGAPDGVAPEPVEGRTVAQPAAVSTGTSARFSHPSTSASGAPDGVAPEPVEGRTGAGPAAVSTSSTSASGVLEPAEVVTEPAEGDIEDKLTDDVIRKNLEGLGYGE